MKQVKLIIGNDASVKGTSIADKTMIFEHESRKSAIGQAMHYAHELLYAARKQYDAPIIIIDDIQLKASDAKKFQVDFLTFKLNFGTIRESLMVLTAFKDEETMIQYIRDTDRMGIFAGVNKFTEQQVAAQGKAQLRLTKWVTKCTKADAISSVIPPEVQLAMQLENQANSAKRLENRKAKAALNA